MRLFILLFFISASGFAQTWSAKTAIFLVNLQSNFDYYASPGNYVYTLEVNERWESRRILEIQIPVPQRIADIELDDEMLIIHLYEARYDLDEQGHLRTHRNSGLAHIQVDLGSRELLAVKKVGPWARDWSKWLLSMKMLNVLPLLTR